ncbi:hypothetical protein D187_000386 [Cystobacter fuscus DSM 2262]|uniref:Uncharacterized protein n=1 Tax=Cystobacter fuscus (strain ATCC 25194 / DSM 2262 / NBRC 100088 / M29) TaxID=1242864 RepID=S9PPI4_CYSF2|nr:hypothetical protein [Cystobacter fuscus]EPX64961.1 hypothetical protein D187_000386 [Cystobacter fuscus DSM 2262]
MTRLNEGTMARFIWQEFHPPEPEAAARFYGALVAMFALTGPRQA